MCESCAAFRARLDREKLAKVMYDHEHEKLGTTWKDEGDEMRQYWYECADRIIVYLEGR
jgi:hypothetical protein